MREQYDLRRRYLLGELRSMGLSALSRRARSICSLQSSPPVFQ